VACDQNNFDQPCTVHQGYDGTCFNGACLPAGTLALGDACDDILYGAVNYASGICPEGTLCSSGTNSEASEVGTCQPICAVYPTPQDGESIGGACSGGSADWACSSLSWQNSLVTPGVGACYPEDGGACLVGYTQNEFDSCDGYGKDLCGCPLSCVSGLCVYACGPGNGCADPDATCTNSYCFPATCFPDGGCPSSSSACYLGSCYQTCFQPYSCSYTNQMCDSQLRLCL
jgi:hypothetical protein